MEEVIKYLLSTYGLAGAIIIGLALATGLLYRHVVSLSSLIKSNTESGQKVASALELMAREVAQTNRQGAELNRTILEAFTNIIARK